METGTIERANEDLVRRIESAWESGELDVLDELFWPEVASYATVPFLPNGKRLEGWKRAHRNMTAAVPDRQVVIEEIVAEANLVAVVCRMTGHNLGGLAWAGVEPNGNAIDMRWISIYRIEDGRVAEHWAINEMLRLVDQLGAPRELVARRIRRGGWPVLS